MLRARIDERSGQLSDTRTRFLGAKPARLFRILFTPSHSHRIIHTVSFTLVHQGVMLRARIDERSGQLSDTRTRFLGAKPARLFRISLGGGDGVLALSSRSWVLYSLAGALHTTPLSYVPLDAVRQHNRTLSLAL